MNVALMNLICTMKKVYMFSIFENVESMMNKKQHMKQYNMNISDIYSSGLLSLLLSISLSVSGKKLASVPWKN